MRRRDREITDRNEIIRLIDISKVCRLGLSDDGMPYIVPMLYGYAEEDGQIVFYFHGARKGRKMDIIAKNPRACVELDMDEEFQVYPGKSACEYSCTYASVIAFGKITVVEDPAVKRRALSLIMKQQTGEDFEFTPEQANWVQVLRLPAEEVTGKRGNKKPTKA